MPKAPTRSKSQKPESPSIISLAKLDQPGALTPMNFRVLTRSRLQTGALLFKLACSKVRPFRCCLNRKLDRWCALVR